MQTSIIVRLQIEGLHSWPEAKIKLSEVAFLSSSHRHMFHIECEKEVRHTDRDLEIIMFKRSILDFLKTKHFDEYLNVVDFGSMSCEMIAHELVEKFSLSFCEVTEDGENGARVRK